MKLPPTSFFSSSSLWVAVLLVCGITCTASLAGESEISAPPRVKGCVVEAWGVAGVFDPGDTVLRPLKEASPLFVGSRVVVQAGGIRAFLVDGTFVDIMEHSAMDLMKAGADSGQMVRDMTVKVLLGSCRLDIAQGFTYSRFTVQTPTASAGVRGTVLGVDVAQNRSEAFDVFDGEIAVATADGMPDEFIGSTGGSLRQAGREFRLEEIPVSRRKMWEYFEAVSENNDAVQEAEAMSARFAANPTLPKEQGETMILRAQRTSMAMYRLASEMELYRAKRAGGLASRAQALTGLAPAGRRMVGPRPSDEQLEKMVVSFAVEAKLLRMKAESLTPKKKSSSDRRYLRDSRGRFAGSEKKR